MEEENRSTGTSKLTYMNWLFEGEKRDYILYKSKELDDITDSKLFDLKVYELLEKTGYSIDKLSTFLFKQLIVTINDLLNSNSNYDINMLRDDLKDKNSSIYIIVSEYLRISTFVFYSLIKEADLSIHDDLNFADKALVYSLYVSKKIANEKAKKKVYKIDNND